MCFLFYSQIFNVIKIYILGGRKHTNKQIGKLQTQKDILRLIFFVQEEM